MKKILAFDIGGTFIKYGIISENGDILEHNKTPTEASKGGYSLMNKLVMIAKQVIEESSDIVGIGISTGGQICPKTGEVLWATEILPGWTGIKVKEIMEKETGLPVFVDNDANAGALGEKWVGSAKDKNDFLFLIVGTGLGGAIFLDNRLYRGNRGSAGEWGHIVLDRSGWTCSCGGNGCFESYASFSGLIRYVKEKAVEYKEVDIDAKTIFERAHQGDAVCKNAVEWFADNLGLGIGNLLHIFNPALVVIGGNLTEEGEDFLAVIKESIVNRTAKHCMPSFLKDFEIRFAECGNDAGMLGAAYGLLTANS